LNFQEFVHPGHLCEGGCHKTTANANEAPRMNIHACGAAINRPADRRCGDALVKATTFSSRSMTSEAGARRSTRRGWSTHRRAQRGTGWELTPSACDASGGVGGVDENPARKVP